MTNQKSAVRNCCFCSFDLPRDRQTPQGPRDAMAATTPQQFAGHWGYSQ